MDGGAFLNWRTDADVDALVLSALSSDEETVIGPLRDLPGSPHGIVDLRSLGSRNYRLRVRTPAGERPLALHESGVVQATRNEGRVGEDTWHLREERDGTLLSRTSFEDRLPGVTSVSCALGIITLAIEPIVDEDLELELRRRGSADRLRVMPKERRPTGSTFRLGAREWDALGMEPGDAVTRWDVWVVRASSEGSDVRLRWSGSSAADPRVSQRHRATVARPSPGSATRVRPYWTLDQYLSVEISRSKDVEGTQS